LTVLVADREGTVRLVVGGPPTGAPLRAVLDLLKQVVP
jgi:predicted transcriptional regulator